MNLRLSSADQAFIDSVRTLLAQHWHGDSAQPGGLLAELRAEGLHPNERAWFDALARVGWSVPTWPVRQGGPGWSRTWQFLFFRELAAAGAPLPVSLASEVVAPAIFASRLSLAGRGWLDGIRNWRSRWCLGVAEPERDGGQQTAARRVGAGYAVSGQKTWVAGGMTADWMLCLVALDQQPVWMIIYLRETGVEIQALPFMGSNLAMARVCLNCVPIAAEACLGVAQPRAADRPVSVASLARSAMLKLDLQCLEAVPSVREDAALQHDCAELGVALDGLEALEFRALMTTDSLEPETLRTMLAIRGAEAGQQLGELRVRSMGYHAVPFPEGERFSNEGVFGDELALPAVRRALFDRAWTMYAAHHAESVGSGASSVEAMRDELARTIMGTNPAFETSVQ